MGDDLPRPGDIYAVELFSDTGQVGKIYQGDEHCGHERIDLVHLGWPLGTETDWLGADSEQFVRDVHDDLSGPHGATVELDGEWDVMDALPEHADDSGWRAETTDGHTVELWLPQEEDPPSEVYLSAGDVVEVWPGTLVGVACD